MRKKGIFLAGCSILATLCLGGAMVGLNAQADSASVTWETGFDIAATTPINSVLTLDNGYAELSGKEYELDTIVTYPDGRQVSNTTFIADVAGEYSVQYSFTAEEETYTTEETFKVVQSPSTFFTGSTAVRMEDNVVAPEWAVIPEVNSEKYGQRYQGLKITPGRTNEHVTYNSLVNLTDNDLDTPLFEFLYVPEKEGSTDLVYIYFTFTDYYDPSNQLIFRMQAGSTISYPGCMIPTAYSSQQGSYKNTWTSIGAIPQGTYEGKKPCSAALYYDSMGKQVYAWPSQWTPTFDRTAQVFINDLDQSTYTDIAWGGIPSGLAYLDITFGNVTSGEGSILLLSLDGQDFATEEVATADEKVYVGVDYTGFDPDNLPHALVGIKYPVFSSVSSSTLSGVFGTTRVSVLDPYGDPVAITDGTFTPTMAGTYTYVYEAVAPSGKIGKKAVAILVDETYRVPLEYVFSSELLEKSNVFDRYYIYKGSELGGEGMRSSVLKVTAPSGADVAVINDGGNDYFIPNEVGAYEISVTMSDYLTEQVFTKVVNIVSEKGVELETPVIPFVLRVGKTFEFPAIYAFKYQGTELEKTLATLKINGEVQTSYTYNVAQEGKISVSYEAEGAETFTQEVECRNLDDGREEFMKDYFYTDTGSFAFEGKKLFYTSTADSHRWQFANMISMEDMSAAIRLVKEENVGTEEEPVMVSCDDDVSKIIFEFVDYKDSNNRIAVELLRSVDEEGNDVFTIVTNGGLTKVAATGNPFFQDYGFKIEKGTLRLLDNAGKFVANVTHRVDAEPFVGFTDDRAYVNIYAVTAGEETFKAQIPTISRQAISNQEQDKAAPMLFLYDIYASARRVLIGENIVFSGAYGYDVLTGFETTVALQIVTPSGQKINVSDASKEYTMVATEYGQYKAQYTVTDSSSRKNKVTTMLSVYVVELDAPELSFDGKYKTSATLKNGAVEVDLAKVAINDASTLPEDVQLMYIVYNELNENFLAANYDEKNRFINTNGVAWTFTEAGEYVVRIVAYDRFNNNTYIEYKLTIKA